MSSSSPINLEGTEQQTPTQHRGKLKIFLGYAPGVGKTYQMLEEAQQLKREGIDIVVGYFEPHARADTIALIEHLEVVPRQVIEYRGARFEEMDTDAILTRHPQVCVVDEFAHTNVPGAQRTKRWQDVMILIENGVNVLTTMNVQHLESLNDRIFRMTGVRVRETVPDWVLHQAAEIVMIDLTPEALLNRLDRGVVYHGDKILRAKENFFQESTLTALRELALRETAFEVEFRQTSGDPNAGVQSSHAGERQTTAVSRSSERVLVYVTAEPSSVALIRRAKRVSDYLKGECIAVAIVPPRHTSDSCEAGAAIDKHLTFARNLQVETHVLTGGDIAEQLMSFVRQHGITQIYLLRPQMPRWNIPFKPNLVQQLVRLARDMEVTIVAERGTRPLKR